MGCMCSTPSVKDTDRNGCSLKSMNSVVHGSAKSLFRRKPFEKDSQLPDRAIPIKDLLTLATEVVETSFKDQVDSIMLTSIIVLESSGDPFLTEWKYDFEETAYGLGQLLYSTAKYLFGLGYNQYPLKEPEELHDPFISMYFTAAYLDYLSKLLEDDNEADDEAVVKAYYRGSKRNQEMFMEFWNVYFKASSQLGRLKAALKPDSSEIQTIHIVQQGETLNLIAKICGVCSEDILQVNPDLRGNHALQIGDCIEIPLQKLLPRLYAVKAGDSLDSIARKHDVSPFRILKSNADLKTSASLKPGWILTIPGLRGVSNELISSQKNDLISAGIEDGPFVLSTTSDKYHLSFEDEDISSFGDYNTFSRDYFRNNKVRRNGTNSVYKLFGVNKQRTDD